MSGGACLSRCPGEVKIPGMESDSGEFAEPDMNNQTQRHVLAGSGFCERRSCCKAWDGGGSRTGQVNISENHNGKRYRHLEKAGCCGMVAGEGRFRSMYLLWYICLSVYLASAIPDR